MKIAVIGGNGKAGSLIVNEALARGHDVTAIVRQAGGPGNATVLVKDLFALTYEDLQAYDVVIDAFGVWAPEELPLHETSLAHLTELLAGKPNRLLVVGGAGSLYVDAAHTLRVMDTPDFPDAFKPLATHMGAALDALKQCGDVRWTYISPSALFVADGPRTGLYTAGGEELLFGSGGESQISYADYAVAMVDEAEQATHIRQRFTVVASYI